MSAGSYREVTRCRVCGASAFSHVPSLGAMPLANAFLRAEHLLRREERFPLDLVRCATCGLVQLGIVVRPEILFRGYVYATSASPPMVAHFAAYADEVLKQFAFRVYGAGRVAGVARLAQGWEVAGS